MMWVMAVIYAVGLVLWTAVVTGVLCAMNEHQLGKAGARLFTWSLRIGHFLFVWGAAYFVWCAIQTIIGE